MSRFVQIAQQVGELVEQKNAAYGNSFAKAGEFLRLLYPNGVQPEQMEDSLLLVRVFDKCMRIATAKDALGEDPWADICGYALLALSRSPKEKPVVPTAGVSPSVPVRGMHANRKTRSRQVLRRRMPDEGLSRPQGPQAC